MTLCGIVGPCPMRDWPACCQHCARRCAALCKHYDDPYCPLMRHAEEVAA